MVRLDSDDVPLNVATSCESEMWTMVLLDMGVCLYTTIWVCEEEPLQCSYRRSLTGCVSLISSSGIFSEIML